MKSIVSSAILGFLLLGSGGSVANAPSPLLTLSDVEKAARWILLFDGVHTTHWRGLGMDGFPTCWTVHDCRIITAKSFFATSRFACCRPKRQSDARVFGVPGERFFSEG